MQKWPEKAQQTTDGGSEGRYGTFSGASTGRKSFLTERRTFVMLSPQTGQTQGTTSGCCCIKILIKAKKYGPQKRKKNQLISRRNSILIPAQALHSVLFPSCSQHGDGAVLLKVLSDWLRDSGSSSPRGHLRAKAHQVTSQLCTTKRALCLAPCRWTVFTFRRHQESIFEGVHL